MCSVCADSDPPSTFDDRRYSNKIEHLLSKNSIKSGQKQNTRTVYAKNIHVSYIV